MSRPRGPCPQCGGWMRLGSGHTTCKYCRRNENRQPSACKALTVHIPRSTHCLVCEGLSWRRAQPSCAGCGQPYEDEPPPDRVMRSGRSNYDT